MIDTKESSRDLDLQIRIRSSTEELSKLEKITNVILETLSTQFNVVLIEKNLNVNRSLEKTLNTIVVILQSE